MALADSKLSPIPMLLAQSELLLTDEQKAELGRLDLDLRASLVAIMAERTLIEIEAERESTTPTSGSGLTAATLTPLMERLPNFGEPGLRPEIVRERCYRLSRYLG